MIIQLRLKVIEGFSYKIVTRVITQTCLIENMRSPPSYYFQYVSLYLINWYHFQLNHRSIIYFCEKWRCSCVSSRALSVRLMHSIYTVYFFIDKILHFSSMLGCPGLNNSNLYLVLTSATRLLDASIFILYVYMRFRYL